MSREWHCDLCRAVQHDYDRMGFGDFNDTTKRKLSIALTAGASNYEINYRETCDSCRKALTLAILRTVSELLAPRPDYSVIVKALRERRGPP